MPLLIWKNFTYKTTDLPFHNSIMDALSRYSSLSALDPANYDIALPALV